MVRYRKRVSIGPSKVLKIGKKPSTLPLIWEVWEFNNTEKPRIVFLDLLILVMYGMAGVLLVEKTSTMNTRKWLRKF